jgi:hypothetical protein
MHSITARKASEMFANLCAPRLLDGTLVSTSVSFTKNSAAEPNMLEGSASVAF